MTGEFGFTCFKVDQTNFVPVFRHQTQLQMSTKIPSNLSVEMQFTCVNYAILYYDCMGLLAITSPEHNNLSDVLLLLLQTLGVKSEGRINTSPL